MKPLARNEIETDFPIYIGAVKQGMVVVYWREINGIIIPGKPGSGKSNTAVWLANQLAANGVKLVRMEYEADESNEQTFINQTSHLAYADFMPYAVEAIDIENTIAALYNLGLRRRTKGTPENENQFPIAIMIDEITSLLNMPVKKIEVTSKVEIDEGVVEKTTQGKRTMMDNLNDMLRMFRKANIKFIVMGQNWQATGKNASQIAQFRRNFNTVLYHKINAKDIDLFDMATTDVKKIIQGLKPGQLYYNSTIVHTPYIAKIPSINIKAANAAREWEHVTYKEGSDMNETKELITRLVTPAVVYKPFDKRWSNARVLAALLNIAYDKRFKRYVYSAYSR